MKSSQTSPNKGLVLTSPVAAQGVLRPPCLLSGLAAQPHVGRAEKLRDIEGHSREWDFDCEHENATVEYFVCRECLRRPGTAVASSWCPTSCPVRPGGVPWTIMRCLGIERCQWAL